MRAGRVEMIDPDNDGTCEKAIFYGARSERQARDYAAREYPSEPARPTRVAHVFIRL
jgi:hypothetical protein